MHTINIERVYADPAGAPSEGIRVLVDRLWPRGESKEEFHYDIWAKDIAPSTELREWFHTDPDDRWQEFVTKYKAELDANPAMPQLLQELRPHKVITLLYSSRDTVHNNAVIVKEYLSERL